MHDEPTDPSETIRMLTDSASAVVSVDRSLSRIRAARFQSPGFSRDTWGAMAGLGWLGLRVGEAAGGLDLGVREAVALARVLGGGLVPEPYLASLFALDLLEAAGLNLDMAPVLSGDVIVLPAWQAAPDAPDPKAGVTVCGGRLTGIKIAIPSGAELFVVTARDGIALVPRDAQGLTITGIAMHDGTFRETLTFDAVACEVHPCAAMDKCLHDAMLLQAAYLQGAAARAFEITLDHLRMRTQFDLPIGSFRRCSTARPRSRSSWSLRAR